MKIISYSTQCSLVSLADNGDIMSGSEDDDGFPVTSQWSKVEAMAQALSGMLLSKVQELRYGVGCQAAFEE